MAVGTSETPVGRQQLALGLNRLALSNGGMTIRVFRSGEAFLTGYLDQQEEVPVSRAE